MRKKATFNPKVCERCGNTYTPTINTQKYCKECKTVVDKERKRAWEKIHKPPKGPKHSVASPCCICGGKFQARIDGKPYCSKHYATMHSYGVPVLPPRNKYQHKDGEVEITVKDGRKIWIDEEDFDAVSRYSWCYSKTGYPVAKIESGKVVKLSRFLMNPPDGTLVDHIDGSKANNRRNNLRLCTSEENSRNTGLARNNTTGVTGVNIRPSGRYFASITVNRKCICLGTFDTIEEASEARREAEIKYFGDFAPSLCRGADTTA